MFSHYILDFFISLSLRQPSRIFSRLANSAASGLIGTGSSNTSIFSNVGRNASYSAFDAAQQPTTESAPPGLEDVVMKLKKEYPNDHDEDGSTQSNNTGPQEPVINNLLLAAAQLEAKDPVDSMANMSESLEKQLPTENFQVARPQAGPEGASPAAPVAADDEAAPVAAGVEDGAAAAAALTSAESTAVDQQEVPSRATVNASPQPEDEPPAADSEDASLNAALGETAILFLGAARQQPMSPPLAPSSTSPKSVPNSPLVEPPSPTGFGQSQSSISTIGELSPFNSMSVSTRSASKRALSPSEVTSPEAPPKKCTPSPSKAATGAPRPPSSRRLSGTLTPAQQANFEAFASAKSQAGVPRKPSPGARLTGPGSKDEAGAEDEVEKPPAKPTRARGGRQNKQKE